MREEIENLRDGGVKGRGVARSGEELNSLSFS